MRCISQCSYFLFSCWCCHLNLFLHFEEKTSLVFWKIVLIYHSIKMVWWFCLILQVVDVGRCIGTCSPIEHCVVRSSNRKDGKCLMSLETTDVTCVPLRVHDVTYFDRHGNERRIAQIRRCGCTWCHIMGLDDVRRKPKTEDSSPRNWSENWNFSKNGQIAPCRSFSRIAVLLLFCRLPKIKILEGGLNFSLKT